MRITCDICKVNMIVIPPWKQREDIEKYLTKNGWSGGVCPECAGKIKERGKWKN